MYGFYHFFLFFLNLHKTIYRRYSRLLFMQLIKSIQEFEDIDLQKAIILKHSNTCSVSAVAFKEVEKFNTKIPIFYLIVQNSRDLSNYISEKYGVKHESPQLLFFKNGVVSWHDSHFLINQDNLKKHVQ